jgi:polyisoprenoid-binding protein YceI
MESISKIITIILIAFYAISTQASAAERNTDANATEWEVDRAHSAINFTINHFFTPVDGSFDDYNASINFDPENLEGSRIHVVIPVESINTRNDRRDSHLRSEDFFNSSQWQNITFESNSIEQTGNNEFVARGELTMRDVTREFDLPFELLGVMEHPMRENTKVAGITANAELNRTDYGVGVGDWAATAVVGDRVNIRINLELTTNE